MKSGIIAYDITMNRYRNKISKLLSGYGQRVQFSVFEFEISDKDYVRMISEVEKIYKEYIKFAY